jgi:hypothetical protein
MAQPGLVPLVAPQLAPIMGQFGGAHPFLIKLVLHQLRFLLQ